MFSGDHAVVPEAAAAPNLLVYFALVAGVIVLPGMDMAFVLARSLAQGRAAGLVAVAGLVCGGFCHLALAGAGLGLLLTTAPHLADTMLLAGSVYLGWVGLTLWRHGTALGAVDPQRHSQCRTSLWAAFGQALLTCLLNPKAYLFMLAVFPRFVRADGGPWLQQVLPLGLITAATQLAVYGSVALVAARLRSALARSPRVQAGMGRAVGAMLVVCAAWAVATGWQG